MVILLRMTRFCPVSLFLKMTCSFINSGIRSVTHINLVVHVMLDSAALPCLLCCGTVGVIVLINHKHAVICHTLIRSVQKADPTASGIYANYLI